MSEFQVGQLVKVKGGGPPLTIDRIRPDGILECMWFATDNSLLRDAFDPETLVPWSKDDD